MFSPRVLHPRCTLPPSLTSIALRKRVPFPMKVFPHQSLLQMLTSWLRKLPAVALLANLPFLLASQYFHLERASINLDYFVFALAAPLFPKYLNLTTFGILVAVDLFLSISGAYYFKVAAAVRALRSVTYLSPTLVVPAAVAVTVAVAAWLRFVGPVQKSQAQGSLRVHAVLVAVLGVATVSETLPAVQPLVPPNMVESVVLRALESADDFEPLKVTADDYWKIESATGNLSQQFSSPDAARNNIALVLVESWGWFNDARVNALLEAPLIGSEIKKRYTVVTGSVPFRGSTVPGELRELCGLSRGFRVAAGATSNLSGCLPWKLRSLGFQAVAIHGFQRQMFNRDLWYPKLGFEREIFLEDMPRNAGYRYCGTQFIGVCDSDVARVMRRELLDTSPDKDRKKLVYWLTLATHLELDDPQSRSNAHCIPSLQGSAADVCALAEGLRSVLGEVAKIAADQSLPNTRFIIVGDHAPPFLIRSKREQFAQDRVPFIELIPGPQQP